MKLPNKLPFWSKPLLISPSLQRNIIIFFVILLSAYFFKNGIMESWGIIKSDFQNYFVASKILIHDNEVEKLYNDPWFNLQLQKEGINKLGKFSPFPPISALIMTPIASFEIHLAKKIWTIVNLILLILIFIGLSKMNKMPLLINVFIVLISGQALINNFALGQVYILLLFLLVLSHLFLQKKPIISGLLLGFCALFKVFPFIFIIGHFLVGRYKVASFSLVSIFLFLVIQLIVFGFPLNLEYFFTVLPNHLQGNLSMQDPYSPVFQSWESLLRNIFIMDVESNPFPLINWPFGKPIVQTIIFGLLFYPLFILYRKNIKNETTGLLERNRIFALLAIAAMVFSPASATYHLLLLIYPICLLLCGNNEYNLDKEQILFLSTFGLIGFIPYGFFYQFYPEFLLLSFPRLFLLLLFYACCLLFGFKKIKHLNNFSHS